MPTVEVTSAVAAWLTETAASTGRSQIELMNEAMFPFLEDLEDVAAAEAELQEIAAGRPQTFTVEEVNRQLGLDDRE